MTAVFLQRHLTKVMQRALAQKEMVSATKEFSLWSMMSSCLQCGAHNTHDPFPVHPAQQAYMAALQCGVRYQMALQKKDTHFSRDLRTQTLVTQHVAVCRNAWRYSILKLARQLERTLGYNAHVTPYFYEVLQQLEDHALRDCNLVPEIEEWIVDDIQPWTVGETRLIGKNPARKAPCSGEGKPNAPPQSAPHHKVRTPAEPGAREEVEVGELGTTEEVSKKATVTGNKSGEEGKEEEELARLIRRVSIAAGTCASCVSAKPTSPSKTQQKQKLLQTLLPLMVRYERMATSLSSGPCGTCKGCIVGHPCVHDWRHVGARPVVDEQEGTRDALLQLGGIRRRRRV